MKIRLGLAIALCVCLLAGSAVAGANEELLFDAARAGDLAMIKRLIEQEGVDVNAKTRYSATALAYASDKGHTDVVSYLVEKGADVNTTDTFYEFTPLGWASFNGHVEIAEALLAAGATGADQVLQAGIRENNAEMVAAALKGFDLTPEALSQARTAAAGLDGGDKIVELLAGVEIEAPEREEIAVSAELMSSYTGNYNNDEIGLGLEIRVEEGKLVAQATGQPPLHLRALSESSFEAVEAPQVKISFAGRGGMIERAVVEQGSQTLQFPRVTETAAAAPTDASAEAEPAPPADPAGASAEAKPAPAKPVVRTAARNWPSFRGPGASGNGDGQGAPTQWNVETGDNVLWKTPIPGLANSSPVIWGDRVFVTTAISGADDDTFRSGLYGDVDSVEDVSEHEFKVYALDRKTGKVLWDKTAAKTVPMAKRHLKSTQANSSPVTDGKHVVALFGTIGLLVGYDMNGKELWRTDVGILDAGWFYDETYQWGHASSPIIHNGLVIVQADIYKDSFIAAYAIKDGKQVWKTARDEVPTWGTPTVYKGKDREELITNGTTIRGYDPATGKELWTLGPNSEVTVATPVIGDGLVYVTAGYPPVRPVYAIRPGGTGDLSLADGVTSNDGIAWSHDRGGTYMPTPIVYDGRLYTCANNGVLTAYDATSGERLFRGRIGGGGTFTASPIAADGKLYFATEEGDIVVVKAGTTDYQELAKNDMGEICMSTPALSDGVLVVRTIKHLFGLGAPPTTEPPAGAR